MSEVTPIRKRSVLMPVAHMVELPKLPNFLRIQEGMTVPVETFTDEQLRALGESWTEALILHAKARRENRENE